MGDIETSNVILQRFVWKDGQHKCEAGKLLCALTELTDSEQHTTKCVDQDVSSYLKEKGLVEDSEAGLHLIDTKMKDAETLGNQISDHIGNMIESIPVNKSIHFAPSILMSPVPIPCYQKQDETKKD